MSDIETLARKYNHLSGGMGECVGSGDTYREIRLPGWPTKVHYEFIPQQTGCSLELHWQLDADDRIRKAFDTIEEGARRLFRNNEVSRSERWVQRHRVAIKVPNTMSEFDQAKTMHHFVSWSRFHLDALAREVV